MHTVRVCFLGSLDGVFLPDMAEGGEGVDDAVRSGRRRRWNDGWDYLHAWPWSIWVLRESGSS